MQRPTAWSRSRHGAPWRRLLLPLLAVAGPVSTVVAVPRTWDGGGGADRDWSTPANWSGDAEPGTGDDAVIEPGDAEPETFHAQITAGNDEQVGSVYVGGFNPPAP